MSVRFSCIHGKIRILKLLLCFAILLCSTEKRYFATLKESYLDEELQSYQNYGSFSIACAKTSSINKKPLLPFRTKSCEDLPSFCFTEGNFIYHNSSGELYRINLIQTEKLNFIKLDSASTLKISLCRLILSNDESNKTFFNFNGNLQLYNISLSTKTDSLNMPSLFSCPEPSKHKHEFGSLTISSSLMDSYFLTAGPLVYSPSTITTNLFFCDFANITSSLHQKFPFSSSTVSHFTNIHSCSFNFVNNAYYGCILLSINNPLHSLTATNTSFSSCSHLSNKRYEHQTLPRTILTSQEDHSFEFVYCQWLNNKGKDKGQGVCLEREDTQVTDIIISCCSFCGCQSEDAGAALYLSGSISVVMENSTIDNCNSEIAGSKNNVGGAINAWGITSFKMSFSEINNCTSKSDAAILIQMTETKIDESYVLDDAHSLLISSCCFDNCSSNGLGGALLLKNLENTFQIDNCSYLKDRSQKGGCIYIQFNDKSTFYQKNFMDKSISPCILMCGFWCSNAISLGKVAVIESDEDLDKGEKLFTNCITDELSMMADEVVQIQSFLEKPIPLKKSLTQGSRFIILDYSASDNVACGSSDLNPCKSLKRALRKAEQCETDYIIQGNQAFEIEYETEMNHITISIDGKNQGRLTFPQITKEHYLVPRLIIESSCVLLKNLKIIIPLQEAPNIDYLIYLNRNAEYQQSFMIENCSFEGNNKKQNDEQDEMHSSLLKISDNALTTFVNCSIADLLLCSPLLTNYQSQNCSLVINCSKIENLTSTQNVTAFGQFYGDYQTSQFRMCNSSVSNIVAANSKSGGFMNCLMYGDSLFFVSLSSFSNCGADSQGGAFHLETSYSSRLIFDQISFSDNKAKEGNDMYFRTDDLTALDVVALFGFAPQTQPYSSIFCVDNGVYSSGIMLDDLLTKYTSEKIYFSAALGVDFVKCGEKQLPCRTIDYGWTHLKPKGTAMIIDLIYFKSACQLGDVEITSSNGKEGIAIIILDPSGFSNDSIPMKINSSMTVSYVNFVCSTLTLNKCVFNQVDGETVWENSKITLTSSSPAEGINYLLYSIDKKSYKALNLSISGENINYGTSLFEFTEKTESINFENISIEGVNTQKDVIVVKTNDKDYFVKQSVQICNFSIRYASTNIFSASSLKDNPHYGRILFSETNNVQSICLINESFQKMHGDKENPKGGAVCAILAPSSELFLKKCAATLNGWSSSETPYENSKGGAFYFSCSHSYTQLTFTELEINKNTAKVGNDIFFSCPDSPSYTTEHFDIKFLDNSWKEVNSIMVLIENDPQESILVDFSELNRFYNWTIYVKRSKENACNLSPTPLKQFLKSGASAEKQFIDDESAKFPFSEDNYGHDVFFCGKSTLPCSTIDYAVQHLKKKSNEHYQNSDDESDIKLVIIGETYLHSFINKDSLEIFGYDGDSAMLLEEENSFSKNCSFLLRKDKEANDQAKISLKGKCNVKNIKLKFLANLTVESLFLFQEGSLNINYVYAIAPNKNIIVPKLFTILKGEFLCNYFAITSMILSGNSALFTFTVSPEDTVRAAFNFCTFKDITLSETGKLISYLNETHTNKNSLDEVQSSTKSLPSLESHSLHLTELPFHNKSSADENLSCLNFTSANVSLISNKPTTTKFISLLRCPSASINNCLISFSEESHSNIALCSKALTHLSEGEDNSMCSWENSLLEFVESNVSIINTNFSTKEMGAITLANGKLELDSVSLSGNFAGITSFPNIAHNIICLNDGSITLTNVGPETESNETFKNYWIMKNQCNLVGFPENLPSYLFVPIPEGVTRTKKENAVDVSLTGKYLINCNLQMAILIGNSSTVTNPLDMSVKETATITDNPHEGIITAEFSSDSIFGIDDNMYVFASLTIENTENPNKSYFTPPILIPRTKPRKPLSPLALSLIIGFSAVIASLILILFFIILRYKKIKRRRLDEAKASSDQNSSNKSSDISQNSQQKSQYRIVLRPVQGLDDEGIVYFPKDEQEPFFED